MDIETLEDTVGIDQAEVGKEAIDISGEDQWKGIQKDAEEGFGERAGLPEDVASSLLVEITLNSCYLFTLQLLQFDENTLTSFLDPTTLSFSLSII